MNKKKKVKPEQQNEHRESDTSNDLSSSKEEDEPFQAYGQRIHENHDSSLKSTSTLRSPIQKPELEHEQETSETNPQDSIPDEPEQSQKDPAAEKSSNVEHAEHVVFQHKGINNNTQQRQSESEYIVYAKGKHSDITKMHPMSLKREIEVAVGRKIVVTTAGNSLSIICKKTKKKKGR